MILSHPCIPDYLSTKCVVYVTVVIFLDIPHKPNIPNSVREDVKQWLITILSSRPSKETVVTVIYFTSGTS